jgi:alpha-galactosidase
MNNFRFFIPVFAVLLIEILTGCNSPGVIVTSGNLEIEFDDQMRTIIRNKYPGAEPLMHHFTSSEYLVSRHFKTDEFSTETKNVENITDGIGSGRLFTVTGNYRNGEYTLQKKVMIRAYDDFPGMAFFTVSYRNTGDREITIEKWVSHHYTISPNGNQPPFWSFQGGSTNARKDWVLPVGQGFYQENYLGMNSSDYGGGIPVTDLWRQDAGIAIGHTGITPLEISLPVEMDKYAEYAEIGVEYKFPGGFVLKKDEVAETAETFVMVHQKDYFNSLQQYTGYMKAKGMTFAETEEEAYGSMWCAWGYERNFTIDEIIGTLPKVKEMGIKWVGIDDGFQVAEGDWSLDPKKFPNGDKDMKRLVGQIHAHGMKAMIWWAPLAADPGSRILREDPDVLLFNDDWSPRFITWWNAWLMSPAYEGTRKHTREVMDMFLKTWDFDGIKIDGQHLNAVPADHHPDHGLEDPQQCIAELPEFFRMVYSYARQVKPDAVIEICPCGCCMSFHLMPYINQAVSSDPTSSWQVRLKGKTYKAIIGKTAYYGDHVELMDNGNDFATQLGIGAVMGTKFTWPKDNPQASSSYLLTLEKEEAWKKWFSLYHQKMLPEGNYLGGLYDIGYEKPETHVIEKNGTLYFAFYQNEWNGSIELRGLTAGKTYHITDYVNNNDYGKLDVGQPFVQVSFNQYLLLEAVPE